MSATVTTNPFGQTADESIGADLTYPNRGIFRGHTVVFRGGANSRRQQKNRKSEWKVVRRLRGIVLDTEGETWKVAFIDNGEAIEYEMPAESLRKQGIKMALQPFEMDEVTSCDREIQDSVGYRFRPLADTRAAVMEPFELSPEHKELRDLILAKFSNPQG